MQIHVVAPKLEASDEPSLSQLLASEARELFAEQAEAIRHLASRVDSSFGHAVQTLFGTEGHVVVTGIGKSGLIGQKMAATFASTGTPSFFVHAAEALHGDLGMITGRDSVILISYSGETDEIVRLLPHLHESGTATIGLVGNMDSTLARGVDVAIDVSVQREACPNNLAPTNSTLATLAMGDALAVALIRMRDFRPEDFARLHPGGHLGRRLKGNVLEVMRTDDLPLVRPSCSMRDCLMAIARGQIGLAIMVDGRGRLLATVSHDDLERAVSENPSAWDQSVEGLGNPRPPVIDRSAPVSEAEEHFNRDGTDLFVVIDGRCSAVCGVLELEVG